MYASPSSLPAAAPEADTLIQARSGFVRWLLVGNALAVLIIAALATIAVLDSRLTYEQRAVVAARNTARAMEQAVAAEIDQVDLLLRAVILGIERERRDGVENPAAVQRILETRRVLLPELQVLRATDERGIVRFGAGVAGAAPIDLSERDYFIRARDGPPHQLVVSQPLVGRTSKRWVMAFARRLNAPDGSFLGIVYATVATERFQAILSTADLGAQGAVSLRHAASMQLVARSSAVRASGESAIGSSTVSEALRQALLVRPGGGDFKATTALDKVERVNAFLPVGQRPLVVIAGLGTSEFLAPWREQALLVAGLAVAVSGVLAGLSVLLVRAHGREHAGLQRLAQASRRNQALLRTASDGIHVLDRQGRLVEASDSFASMLGRTREQMLGRPASDWEATVTAGHIEQWCRSTQGQARFSTRHRRSDGTEINVEVTSTTVNIDGDDLIYCSARDVTERRRLEAEVRRSLERAQHSEQQVREIARNLAAMTAVSGDVSLVMDLEGRILVANRAFEDNCALPPGGAAGRTLESLYGAAFFHDVVAPRIRRVIAGETVNLRTQHELRGRGLRSFDVTYEGVRNDEGRIDAVVFTSHDVNDLVEAVAKLRSTNESLEQFVRITSHDMREPLNTISQFVGLIERQHPQALVPPVDRYFGFVGRAALRMRAMLDDLLCFVRLEGRAEAVAPERVALSAVLHEVEAALQARIAGGGGRLTVGPLPAVRGQPALLVLLFQNLVSNGLKFTRAGLAPEVSVRAAVNEGEAEGEVAVCVEDRGVGIAAGDIPTLFQPFRRLHRRDVYEGTGLGLAICKRIVATLGGRIEIRSEPGAWTRVIVVLPAA